MPLQTWPGQECVSACLGFIRLLGCPEAFPASLQHTPGPRAPKRFPMRHLAGASPPVGTHLKSPAGCSMLREVRSQHLWQTRSRSPSSFLAPGGQIIKCVGACQAGDTAGRGHGNGSPRDPKQTLVGAWGCGAGRAWRREQTRAPTFQTRAKRGLRSRWEPPLTQELPLHPPISRIKNFSYVVESRCGRSSGRNLGAVAFKMKNPGEREDRERHWQV